MRCSSALVILGDSSSCSPTSSSVSNSRSAIWRRWTNRRTMSWSTCWGAAGDRRAANDRRRRVACRHNVTLSRVSISNCPELAASGPCPPHVVDRSGPAFPLRSTGCRQYLESALEHELLARSQRGWRDLRRARPDAGYVRALALGQLSTGRGTGGGGGRAGRHLRKFGIYRLFTLCGAWVSVHDFSASDLDAQLRDRRT